MLRFVAILLVSVLLITVVKSIVGVVMRGFADMMRSQTPAPAARRETEVPAAGELKKDPVCGTYVSSATALKKTTGTQTVYFCSRDCLQRYQA